MASGIELKWRLLVGATALLVLPVMCLEKTTGVAGALDERFTVGEPEGAALIEHDPDAGKVEPFGDLDEDDAVFIAGLLVSELEEPIDVDLLTADPTVDAGYIAQGKLQVDGPQEFSLRAPKGLGELKLLAFQDVDGNGPSDDDPFAGLTVLVGDEDVNGVILELVVGAYSEFDLNGASSRTAFPDHEGEWTLVSGTLSSPLEQTIAVDVLAPATDGDELAFLTKTQLDGPGAYEIALPRGLGPVTLQFFQDASGDGPDSTDPFVQVVFEVQEQPRIAKDLELVPGAYVGLAQPDSEGSPGEQSLAQPEQVIFEDLGENPVTLSGELSLEGVEAGQVSVDVYRVDGAGHGGRSLLKKVYVAPGSFSFQAPSDYGQLIFEASIDADGDGPTPGDPQGACEQNPVTVGSQDVVGLRIVVRG